MKKNSYNPFLNALHSGKLLFLDGAMGTRLQAAGMPPGLPPERFCLDNPAILLDIHLSYLMAGADIVTTCTFGANSCKLPGDMDVYTVNRDLAQIAREAAVRASARLDKPVFVAGDVGPTGHFVKPLGDLSPLELIKIFERQIQGLQAGGVDLIFMETQFDIAELRCAILAARNACDLPVMASMTFEQGVSLTGSTPEIFAETVQNMDIDVLGTNCSLGPDEMLPVVKSLLASSSIPVMAEPNAGLPELKDGKTVFPQNPPCFAEKTANFAALGVQILGGCCGTTPEHIRELCRLATKIGRHEPPAPQQSGSYLTSRTRLVNISQEAPFAIIGERINPTGKPVLSAQLQKGEFQEALKLADEQIAAGCQALDVNVGAPLVNEANLLPDLTALLSGRTQIPLSLDSSNSEAIAKALPWYPASCLVNSISGEPGRMEILGPLCRLYGAPFILLPLTGTELPVKSNQRIGIAETLIQKALDMGIQKRLILIDVLALSVSSNPDGGRECLEMLRWCVKEGFATTVGLSNISFGLPARSLLNSTFLAMAAACGLSSCIGNPTAPRMRETVDSVNLLLAHDPDARCFIADYAKWQAGGDRQGANPKQKEQSRDLAGIILNGDRENVIQAVEKELAAGADPYMLVNDVLIPAITRVGALYEKKEYFLPQLIRSAETMQLAFERLKPLLEERGENIDRPVIVMATVEGDIHDIGKNIVSLLLGNHGFEVIDAGKDVPAAEIVACAEKHDAKIIGLSALMTTTMVRMEDTIKLVKERRLPVKVMVGGAAVTPEFAQSIGADAYCADAVEGVRAASAFIQPTNN